MVLGPQFKTVLAAAQAGAEWAWVSIYKDLAGSVKGYFAVRGVRDAEDLAGETFLQIARDIGTFRGDEDGFRSWVFVIAHRRLIDAWRSIEKRPRIADFDEPLPDIVGGNTEHDALDRMAISELLPVLKQLTEDQRAVLTLRVVGDLSVEQTAEILGKRPGAVRALQFRALATLQSILEDTVTFETEFTLTGTESKTLV